MTTLSQLSSPRFKVERISFPDSNDWWEIRSVLNVALDREYADIALQSQRITDVDITSAERDSLISSLAKRSDALLLKVTVAWSYSSIVDEATLHNEIPASHYNEVGKRLVTLYSPLVLARIENLLNAYSSLSNPESPMTLGSPSPLSSPTPT